MASYDKNQEITRISVARYNSSEYVVKPDRLENVRPIIIANWESFDVDNERIMKMNRRLEEDAKLIKSTLMKKYCNKVQIVECFNLTQEELMVALNSEAQKIPNRGKNRPDFLLCFIIARGRSNFFYDIRKKREEASKRIYFKEIMDIFNGENCAGLVLRPKLFFIQTEMKARKSPDGNFRKDKHEDVQQKTIPVEADVFLYTSTALSEFEEKEPSRFVTYLCEAFEPKTDVFELTLNVNRRMFDFTRDGVHIPLCTSQLTKSLTL